MNSIIQDLDADFLRIVSLKILNSGIILKTFTYAGEFESYLVGTATEIRDSHDLAQIDSIDYVHT